MAIVVEDGTGVTGANSYVSEAEVTTYATNRGITISGTVSELIYKSMDWIETRQFTGERTTETQPLSFPRKGIYVDGVEIEKDEIPERLKSAQIELCIQLDAGNDPQATTGQQVKREKADVVEVEYQDYSSDMPITKRLTDLIRPLLVFGGGSFGFVGVTRV